MRESPIYKVEVSAKTIVFTIFFIIFLLLIWYIRSLFLSLFIAFIISSAAKPIILFLESKRIPRSFATILFFTSFILFFIFLAGWILPPLIVETTLLIKHLPSMIQAISPSIIKNINIDFLFQYVPNITNQTIQIIKTTFSNIMFVFTTLFFSLYFTVEPNFLKNEIKILFNKKEAERIISIFEKTEERLGLWLVGELILMLAVGILTYAGLSLIGVRYALPLSIIAGLLEVVPNLGPTIATIPAFIVGVAQSYFLGAATIALYFIVQQLENNIIVPVVMKRVMGLNPIITLIALIIGGQLFGILGVLLSIPLTLFIEAILLEIVKEKQRT